MKLLAFFVLFAISAFAQSTPYVFECSKLPTPSPGCKSYNEMVVANDKDLLSWLKENSSFVCFRPEEDVFFLLGYSNSSYAEFQQVGSVYEEMATVYYSRYKNG